MRKGQRESHRYLGEIGLECSILSPIVLELKEFF